MYGFLKINQLYKETLCHVFIWYLQIYKKFLQLCNYKSRAVGKVQILLEGQINHSSILFYSAGHTMSIQSCKIVFILSIFGFLCAEKKGFLSWKWLVFNMRYGIVLTFYRNMYSWAQHLFYDSSQYPLHCCFMIF